MELGVVAEYQSGTRNAKVAHILTICLGFLRLPDEDRGGMRELGQERGTWKLLSDGFSDQKKKYCIVKASGPIPAASSGLPESFKWKPWMPLLDWGPRSGTPPCPPGAREGAESSNGGGHRRAGLPGSHQGELGRDEKVTYCSVVDRLGNPTISSERMWCRYPPLFKSCQ